MCTTQNHLSATEKHRSPLLYSFFPVAHGIASSAAGRDRQYVRNSSMFIAEDRIRLHKIRKTRVKSAYFRIRPAYSDHRRVRLSAEMIGGGRKGFAAVRRACLWNSFFSAVLCGDTVASAVGHAGTIFCVTKCGKGAGVCLAGGRIGRRSRSMLSPAMTRAKEVSGRNFHARKRFSETTFAEKFIPLYELQIF